MLLSRDIEHCIPILYIAVLYPSLFGLLGYYVMAQRVSVTIKLSSSDIDPVVTVFCMEYDLPSEYTNLMLQWEHNGIVLSRDDVLVDADSSRYSVGNNGRDLFIQNAVRDDGGRYTCRVLYRLSSDSQVMNVSNSAIVSITKYLPPSNYPECSISPNTGITVDNEVTFICDAGDAESSALLTLQIQTPDGSSVISSMVKWTVREEDMLATIVCSIKSNTFPTAERTCFATIIITTTTTQPQNLPTTSPTHRIPSISVSHISSTDGMTPPLHGTIEQDYTTFEEMVNTSTATSGAVIAGAVVGGLLVLLVVVIVVVIILFRRKYQKETPSSLSSNNPRDAADMRVSATGNIHSEETTDNIDTVSSNRPSTTTGHTPNELRPVSVVYGVVDKTKSRGEITSTNSKPQPINPKSNGNAVYEIADLDKRPPVNPADPDAGGSEMPVYGKVNKGYTTDAKDDSEDKRESSGFVDNAIYVSSQM